MKKFVTIISLFLVLAVAAQSEVYVKSKTHADAMAMANQPAKDGFNETWVGNDKFAMIQDEQVTIVDFKKNLLLIINHKDKTYVETGLPLDLNKILPAQAAQMMAGMGKINVTVKPNGQTKKVGQWNCSGYEVAMTMMMMPIQMTFWATTDVPAELSKFMEKGYTEMMKTTYFLDDSAVSEMKKIKGYPISTIIAMDIMGTKMNISTEVVEISQKTPPASVYTVPAGYQKTDTMSVPGGIR